MERDFKSPVRPGYSSLFQLVALVAALGCFSVPTQANQNAEPGTPLKCQAKEHHKNVCCDRFLRAEQSWLNNRVLAQNYSYNSQCRRFAQDVYSIQLNAFAGIYKDKMALFNQECSNKNKGAATFLLQTEVCSNHRGKNLASCLNGGEAMDLGSTIRNAMSCFPRRN